MKTIFQMCVFATLCAGLTACEEPEEEGRGDVMRWYVFDGEPEPSPEDLEVVEEIFGLQLERSNTFFGAVTLIITKDGVPGTSHGVGGSCTPFIHLDSPDPVILAHEFGHAYGLPHVYDDPDNLMAPEVSGDYLSEEQIDTVRKTIWITEGFCKR